ncbi:hypothetical protein PYCC9005_005157 [Savitreella phatthalungensis]
MPYRGAGIALDEITNSTTIPTDFFSAFTSPTPAAATPSESLAEKPYWQPQPSSSSPIYSESSPTPTATPTQTPILEVVFTCTAEGSISCVTPFLGPGPRIFTTDDLTTADPQAVVATSTPTFSPTSTPGS